MPLDTQAANVRHDLGPVAVAMTVQSPFEIDSRSQVVLRLSSCACADWLVEVNKVGGNHSSPRPMI